VIFFILAYMSSPSHIEFILTEKQAPVAKAPETTQEKAKKKVSKKKLARERIRGGGAE